MREAIVLTGATSGLGLEISKQLSRFNLAYVLGGRRNERVLLRVGRRAGTEHDPGADLPCTQPIETDLIHHEVGHSWSRLLPEDVKVRGVIHCAGMNIIKPSLQVSEWDMEQIMAVNVYAFTNLVSQYADGLRWALAVGSNAQDGAGKHSLAYVVSKHALLGAVRSLARDYGAYFPVTLVAPPKLAGTEMSRLIEERQATLRGVDVEEERARQRASAPGGENMGVRPLARFITDMLENPNLLKATNGTVLRIGYPS